MLPRYHFVLFRCSLGHLMINTSIEVLSDSKAMLGLHVYEGIDCLS